MKSKKILFVCWGNIFRSPAAKIFLDRAIKKKGLENFIKCDSAGIQGSANIPPPKFANFTFYQKELEAAGPVLKKFNLDFSKLKSKPVSQKLISEFDVILAMDNKVLAFLKNEFPGYKTKIFLFSLFFGRSKEIEDPDGVTIEKKYATITQEIKRCITLKNIWTK